VRRTNRDGCERPHENPNEPQNFRPDAARTRRSRCASNPVGPGSRPCCHRPVANHTAQTADRGWQIYAGRPARASDHPQHPPGLPASAGALESPLGGLRGEPGPRLPWQARPHRGVGQQFTGDRSLRGPARRRVSVRGGAAPARSRRRGGLPSKGRTRGGGDGAGEPLLRGGPHALRSSGTSIKI